MAERGISCISLQLDMANPLCFQPEHFSEETDFKEKNSTNINLNVPL